jgi:putative copper export protein/methionine-rich copper-binding protein CopC
VARRLPALLAGALLSATLAAVLSGVLVGVRQSPAGAHALLASSSPADGATVDRPPAEMLLVFTEALDPALSTVRVTDTAGTEVTAGPARPVPGQPAQLRVPLGSLAEGAYTAAWRVTSPADGHTTIGAVAFGVGVPVDPIGAGAASGQVDSPSPTLASVAGRWLFYVGVVGLLGAAVVGVWVVAAPAVVSRRLLAGAWAAAAAGMLLTFADQVAAAQAGLGTLLSSSTGTRLVAQALAVGLAGVAVALAWRRPRRSSLALVGLGAATAMLARALAGHANASSPRWFTVGMQWVHLVAVGAWIGGLAWLLVALRRGDPGQGRGLARRFSTVAGATLVVVAASGTARALDEVGAWNRLLDTEFGLTLVVKLGLFAGLVALGASSRFRHVAAASAGHLWGLRRSVRAEVAIAAGVLGLTAWLTGLPPSTVVAAASRDREPTMVTVTASDEAADVRVRLVVNPGTAGGNRFDAAVEHIGSRQPVAAEAVSLRFQPPGRPDAESATVELAREPDAHWRASSGIVSVPGRWTITAVVQTAGDAVEVPMELVARPRPGRSSQSGPGCTQGTADPAYSVDVTSAPDPPRAEGTAFTLVVRNGGAPVTGARVCLTVDMPEMQHPGVSAVAGAGDASGRYPARLTFLMTGVWVGSVVVTEPGREPVSVPVLIDVK